MIKKKRTVWIGMLILSAIVVITAGCWVFSGERITYRSLSVKQLTVCENGGSTAEITDLKPGEAVPVYVPVVNDSKTEYDTYVRVIIHKIWEQMPLRENSVVLDGQSDNWILGSETADKSVYYYKKPLDPGEKTDSCIARIYWTENAAGTYSGREPYGRQQGGVKILCSVQSVQAADSAAAFVSEWEVLPAFDERGSLTRVDPAETK